MIKCSFTEYIDTPNLYVIRFSTDSQCSLFNIGMTCAEFGSEQISRVAYSFVYVPADDELQRYSPQGCRCSSLWRDVPNALNGFTLTTM